MSDQKIDRNRTPAGQPVRIDLDAWYTDSDLRLVLGLSGASLRAARRAGALRYTRRGLTSWHKGHWVNLWLSGAQAEGDGDAR